MHRTTDLLSLKLMHGSFHVSKSIPKVLKKKKKDKIIFLFFSVLYRPTVIQATVAAGDNHVDTGVMDVVWKSPSVFSPTRVEVPRPIVNANYSKYYRDYRPLSHRRWRTHNPFFFFFLPRPLLLLRHLIPADLHRECIGDALGVLYFFFLPFLACLLLFGWSARHRGLKLATATAA